MSFVLRHEQDGICTLTLNRPQQFNALSCDVLTELQTQLTEIQNNQNIKVVVLTAEGKAFCAGHDLKEMCAFPDQNTCLDLFQQCSAVMLQLTQLPQPVIAKVQGLATAAGCQLIAACDLAVAAEHTRFAVSGITLDLFCSTPAVALSRNIGRKRALEMLFTGEFIDAETALAWGLLNRVVPAEQLDQATLSLAQNIAAKSAAAMAIGKRGFYQQIEQDLATAYQTAAAIMAENFFYPDTKEGITAFVEKRPKRHS